MAAKFKLGMRVTPRKLMGKAHPGLIYEIISYNKSLGSLTLYFYDSIESTCTVILIQQPWDKIEANFDIVTSLTCFDIPSDNINLWSLL